MRILSRLAGLVCTAVVAGVASAAPLSITLPAETGAWKPSALPGHAVAVQKCTLCHSIDYIDYQPPAMTLGQWTAEMKKMKALYGAPIDDAEVDALAAYLTASYGDASTVPRTVGVASPASSSAASAPAPQPRPAGAGDVQKLLADNGCLACHASDHPIVGPAYHAVAARYAGDGSAPVAVRAHIREGGSGRWGTVPMPPFAALTDAEAGALAAYVLAQ